MNGESGGSGSVTVRLLQGIRAHQQPVRCLEHGGNKVVTGSMDHTLKVFRWVWTKYGYII